jgi:hypothetical protein
VQQLGDPGYSAKVDTRFFFTPFLFQTGAAFLKYRKIPLSVLVRVGCLYGLFFSSFPFFIIRYNPRTSKTNPKPVSPANTHTHQGACPNIDSFKFFSFSSSAERERERVPLFL